MKALCKAYDGFFSLFTYLKSPLVLLLRIYFGMRFFWAGWGKFPNMEGVIEFFGNVGVPYPQYMAYIVASIEVVGGIALVIGFGSRFFAFLLTCVMVGAYSTAHIESVEQLVFNLSELVERGTYPIAFIKEQPFNFLMTSLIVLIGGPGYFSVDKWLRRRCGCSDTCA